MNRHALYANSYQAEYDNSAVRLFPRRLTSLVASNKQHGITDLSSITPTQCRRLLSPDSHKGKFRYMIYDIYSLQLGFHPVAMVGKIVQKQERDKLYTKGQTLKKQ